MNKNIFNQYWENKTNAVLLLFMELESAIFSCSLITVLNLQHCIFSNVKYEHCGRAAAKKKRMASPLTVPFSIAAGLKFGLSLSKLLCCLVRAQRCLGFGDFLDHLFTKNLKQIHFILETVLESYVRKTTLDSASLQFFSHSQSTMWLLFVDELCKFLLYGKWTQVPLL